MMGLMSTYSLNDLALNQNLNKYIESSLQGREVFIFSDYEPDDREAMKIATAYFRPEQVHFVGATVMHAARKKALIARDLSQLGWPKVPVYQGTGGNLDDYGNILGDRQQKVNSVKAAATYLREGRGILSDEQLECLAEQSRSSGESQDAIYDALSKTSKKIDIIMLAPPTDLAQVLSKHPHLKEKIGEVHIMGGWNEVPAANGSTELRTTYNWDMDPEASATFMKMSDLSMTLYDTFLMRNTFKGAINKDRFPQLIEKIKQAENYLASAQDAAKAKRSWNSHVKDTIPALVNIIGPYEDHQYTPADPATVIGMICPAFIKKKKPISITIDPTNQNSRGSLVKIENDASSKIMLVEEVEVDLFSRVSIAAYERLMESQSVVKLAN